MIDFVLVDHPAVHPQCCVICGGAKGPLVDTIGERWGERIYLCRLCVKRAASIMGFVKGEKADQLENAIDVVAGKDSEIAALMGDVKDLRGKLGHEQKKVAALQTLIEDVNNRERTRSHLAAELAGIASQLVTVGDPVFEETS
jgi:hypothetical protein